MGLKIRGCAPTGHPERGTLMGREIRHRICSPAKEYEVGGVRPGIAEANSAAESAGCP